MASINKRPNGLWRARYRDEAGREHARHFNRKIDAQRWLDEVTATVVTGTYVDPRAGAVTFVEFYRGWAARQVWAPNTAKSMRVATDSVTFGDLPLRAIKPSHVEQWVKSMTVAGLAASTIGTRYNCVRSVFRAAHRDKLIATDPTEAIALPRRRRREVAMRIPTPETVGKIVAGAEQWFAPFVGLCAFAGLRLGEAAGVKIDDIDFLRKTLTVSRQVQRAGAGKVDIRPPKYNSERVVYLPDQLVMMLAAHVEHVGVRPAGWLFIGAEDGPPQHDIIYWWWAKALRGAGVSGVKLHDLRHFYASGLIAAGCDVVTVQRALGHGSATTTLGTYSHLWPTAEDRTRKAAGAMMRTALTDSADSLRTGVE
jgi:integrase